MDSSMQVDAVSTLSGNRKRSVSRRDADSEDEQPVADDPLATSPKRLRNSKGDATHRPRVLKYNARALLNNLAFTRLYVTANFQNYRPSVSPVILCIVSEQDLLYRALCQVLPALYGVAPDLQALAIVLGQSGQLVGPSQDLARVVPVTTLSGLQEDTVDNFLLFVQALPGPADSVVAIDPSGACVWTSGELQIDDSCPVRGAAWLKSDLERALVRVLTGFRQPDLMDED